MELSRIMFSTFPSESPYKTQLRLMSQWPASQVRSNIPSDRGDFIVLGYTNPNTNVQSYYCGVRIIAIFSRCCMSHNMMTSSNGNIFRVTGHLCGEFTGPGEFPAQRPVTRSFDVFFNLSLNKRLSKQSWGWWFETQSRPLWRHWNKHVNCFVVLCSVVVMSSMLSMIYTLKSLVQDTKSQNVNVSRLGLQLSLPYHGFAMREVSVNSTSLHETI